jgi:hypothetical protein
MGQLRFYFTLFCATFVTIQTVQANVQRPPQFVMLSFDGSKSVSFWKESRDFATKNNLNFTYFASGVYFLADASKSNYKEPRFGAGKSAIGFGGKKEDIQPRLQQMVLAMGEGNEMGSHANAHYDGSAYTEAMWDSEFAQFTSLMTNAWNHSGIAAQKPNGWDDYFQNHVWGFRAPLLGKGNGLWASMQNNNYVYDASRVDRMNYWPQQLNNLWNFPLVGLTIAGTSKKTLSMDYNFYVGQSGGEAGPANKYALYEQQMYDTYMAYFNNNYSGNRAPLHIGHHFSKWNGGAYWNAMMRFAKSVCSKPEVRCVVYKDLVEFLETNKASIASYQAGDFDKLARPLRYRPLPELSDEELEDLRLKAADHVRAHED